MQIEREVKEIGGSLFIIVPPDYCKHIGVISGSKIIIQDDIGKHGKFISFWKKEVDKNVDKDTSN